MKNSGYTRLLTPLVGVGLIVAAIVALIGHQKRHPHDENPAILRRGGALVGTLVAWTSVGSGSLITALLMSQRRLSPERVVGTDITHAVVASTLLASIHIIQGSVVWTTAVLLIVGGIPGVIIGSRLTVKLPKPMLWRPRFTSSHQRYIAHPREITMAHVIHHELNALPYERAQWAESASTLELLDWIWGTFGKKCRIRNSV